MAITKNGAPTSRRAILTTSVAAAGTGLLAASTIETAEAGVVDPHPAWLERWRVANTESLSMLSVVVTGDPEPEAALILEEEAHELHRLIAVTPARTTAGAAAKLRLLYEQTDGGASCCIRYEQELMASALATLEAQEV